jgi:hypothetical protein
MTHWWKVQCKQKQMPKHVGNVVVPIQLEPEGRKVQRRRRMAPVKQCMQLKAAMVVVWLLLVGMTGGVVVVVCSHHQP